MGAKAKAPQSAAKAKSVAAKPAKQELKIELDAAGVQRSNAAIGKLLQASRGLQHLTQHAQAVGSLSLKDERLPALKEEFQQSYKAVCDELFPEEEKPAEKKQEKTDKSDLPPPPPEGDQPPGDPAGGDKGAQGGQGGLNLGGDGRQ